MMSSLNQVDQLPRRMPIAVRTRLAIILPHGSFATRQETASSAFLQEQHFGLVPNHVPISMRRWHQKRRRMIFLATLSIFIPVTRDGPSHISLHLSLSVTSQKFRDSVNYASPTPVAGFGGWNMAGYSIL